MVDFKISVVVDPSGAVSGTRTVERELVRVENRADRLRGTLARAFGFLGTGALVAGGIRTLANFEQAMSTVGAVSGATADELQVLRDKALELGAATRFGATAAADAIGELARAGFSATESLAAVGDTLVLAQAGGLGLAQATEIASTSIRAFRLQADQAGRVADVLAGAANASNSSVQELAEGMKFAAPIAATLGVSIEETAAALGVLSDSGLKGSLGGTGLRQIFSGLLNPTNEAKEAFKKFGLTEADIDVRTRGLIPVLQKLRDSGFDVEAALQAFGDRGGPAFEVLQAGLPKVDALTEGLRNSAGTARETARIMDDNLNGALLRVKSAFESLVLALGGAGASSGLRAIFESLAQGIRFVAANADVLINFLQNLALFLGPRYVLGAIKALTVAIAANPLGLLLTVIAAVVAAIPDFQGKLMSLIGTIGELATSLTEGLDFSTFFQGIAGAIDGVIALFEGLLAAGGAVFDALSTQPEAAGELMKKGFRDAIEAMLDFLLAFAATSAQIISGIGQDFIDLARNVGGAIGAISVGNLEAAQTFADNLTGTLSRTANRLTTFTGQFKGAFKQLSEQDLLPTVQLSAEATDLGKKVAAEFERGVSESTPSAQQALDNLLGKPDEIAAEAARRAAELTKNLPQAQAPPPALREAPLSADAQELQKVLDVQAQLADQERVYQELLARRPDLEREIQDAQLATRIAALESSTALEDGFTRAFLKIQQEARDLAAVAEQVVNVFADKATDAILEFTKTGELNFKKFATSILEEITRILVRLLVVQALNAAISGLGGGGGALVNTAATAATAGGGGGRASGGTVQPDRSYMVGEKGPELFQPNQTGTIVPNQASASQPPPQVNVQVVNVDDPNKVPQAITSGEADEAIINALARNKDRVSQVIR